MGKGQVGDTVTWIVATIIIVVILVVGVSIAGGKGIVKNVFGSKDISYYRISDNFAGNSFYSFLETDFGEKNAYESIKEYEELSDEEIGNFAVKVFRGIYDEVDCRDVWFGTMEMSDWRIGEGVTFNGDSNDFFGGRPKTEAQSNQGVLIPLDFVSNYLSINENKSLELLLVTYLK